MSYIRSSIIDGRNNNGRKNGNKAENKDKVRDKIENIEWLLLFSKYTSWTVW